MIGHLRSGLAALPIVLLSFALLSGAFALQAKDPPSDLCALLPAAQLDKALQETYDPPAKSTAPAAFPGDASGSEHWRHAHAAEGASYSCQLFRG